MVCRMFSKRFSGAIFRGKPETYLLKLQSTGLRNIDGGFSRFRAAGDAREEANDLMMFLLVGWVFLLLFLTGSIIDLKNKVMRI